MKPMKILYISLGWVAVALGFIGIFLPLLPTTPFLILAAYFFSKGSTRLHQWLLGQPHLGPIIKDWEAYGMIPLKAKIVSTIAIVALFSFTLIKVQVVLWIKAIVAATGVGVLTFIWSRPHHKRPSQEIR